MPSDAASSRIIIAGAGPTGLMLGCFLAQKGLDFSIVEPRMQVSQHSRSIGIHPPSIALFEQIGLLPRLLEAGNKITTGRAFVNQQEVGAIDFARLPHDHPFILTVSQEITERLLETRLEELAPGCLQRGRTVTGFRQPSKKDATTDIEVFMDDGSSEKAAYMIACDGKNSGLREQAGIPFKGGEYPDVYVMGDFEDGLAGRNEALVFLCEDGLVESFPHGSNTRRWVIKTKELPSEPDPGMIASEAGRRTGLQPDVATNSMCSAFGVQRLMAESFFKKRLILAGDAAHVVSPIGGQGMNLGWLDVQLLSELLPDIVHPEKPRPQLLNSYEYRRRNAAYEAAQRAEFNLKMGRAYTGNALNKTLKKLTIKTMLFGPVQTFMLKKFTMHGLD
jgi:2-polyprenyl-6-methoxyphenol hydroxylase-like FAD-dependent oxidoreductase